MAEDPDEVEMAALSERLADMIRESRDFARAAYGYDFDQERRAIPPDATPLEIEQLAHFAAIADTEFRHWDNPLTRAIYNHPRLLAHLGLGGGACYGGDEKLDDEVER